MNVKTVLVLSLFTAASAARAGDIALDSIQLTVVDARSGKPVEGAVVAVTYPVYYEAGRNLHEGPWYEQSGDLYIAETLTSANGEAAFPAVDVEAPPPGRYVRHDVPLLLVYKAGYQPSLLTEEPRNDNYKGVMPPPARIASSLDGDTVRLEPEPAGGLTEINVNQAAGFLEGQFRTTASCRWMRMPRLLDALSAAARTRPALGKRLEHVTGDRKQCALQFHLCLLRENLPTIACSRAGSCNGSGSEETPAARRKSAHTRHSIPPRPAAEPPAKDALARRR